MPEFNVIGKVVGSKYLGKFEAKNKKEAEKMALESEAVGISLCHQCSGECEDPIVEKAYAEKA